MVPSDPAAFEHLISKPRLDSYRGYFNVNRDEAIGLYMWNCELSACCSTLLSHFEVGLRNSIHRELSLSYSAKAVAAAARLNGAIPSAAAALGQNSATTSFHWYDAGSLGGSLNSQTKNKVIEVRDFKGAPRLPPPSPDEIVSRVTFGFWPHVLNAISNGNANAILPKIFPNHPLNAQANAWANSSTRTKAFAYLRELNEFRNRIAHLEPIWKFPKVTDYFFTPPKLIAKTSNMHDSINRLNRFSMLLDHGFNSISPKAQSDISGSSWRQRFDFCLSAKGIERFMKEMHCAAPNPITLTEFVGNFCEIASGNQPTT